jgi:hypothetical protein
LQILFNLLMIILLHLRQQRQNSVDETLQKWYTINVENIVKSWFKKKVTQYCYYV